MSCSRTRASRIPRPLQGLLAWRRFDDFPACVAGSSRHHGCDPRFRGDDTRWIARSRYNSCFAASPYCCGGRSRHHLDGRGHSDSAAIGFMEAVSPLAGQRIDPGLVIFRSRRRIGRESLGLLESDGRQAVAHVDALGGHDLGAGIEKPGASAVLVLIAWTSSATGR